MTRLFPTLLLLLALIIAGPISAKVGQLENAAAMRAVIESKMREVGAPGAVWVAVVDGRVAYTGASGVVSVRTGVPLTDATPMLLGSISKTIAATALMKLVEQGRVKLDAPVRAYLPWFRLTDEQAAARITVRQLLSHTSGLGTFDGTMLHLDLSMAPNALEQAARRLSSDGVVGPPGTFAYSNSNFLLVGAIVQAVSGEPYERYVERHVFQPLGMRDSFIVDPPAGAAMPAGHRYWFGQVRADNGPLHGRASAPTRFAAVSARDLGRFLAMMASGRDDLLRASTKAEMTRVQPGAKYNGLGWNLRRSAEPYFAFHRGATPGFEAVIAAHAESGQGFGIITNAGSWSFGRVSPFLNAAFEEAFGLSPTPRRSRSLEWGLFGVLGAVILACLIDATRTWRRARRRPAVEPKRGFWRWAVPIALVGLAAVLIWVVPPLFSGTYALSWIWEPTAAILFTAAATALVLAAAVRAVWPGGASTRAAMTI